MVNDSEIFSSICGRLAVAGTALRHLSVARLDDTLIHLDAIEERVREARSFHELIAEKYSDRFAPLDDFDRLRQTCLNLANARFALSYQSELLAQNRCPWCGEDLMPHTEMALVYMQFVRREAWHCPSCIREAWQALERLKHAHYCYVD